MTTKPKPTNATTDQTDNPVASGQMGFACPQLPEKQAKPACESASFQTSSRRFGDWASCNPSATLRDAKTSKDRNLYYIQDQPEHNSPRKLTGDNRERQWRHGDSENRERWDDKNIGH